MTHESAEFARLQNALEAWLVATDRGESPDLLTLCDGDEALAKRVRSALDNEGTAVRSLLQSIPLNGAKLPRERLGNFQLLQAIGRGGMATVYLAEDLSLPRFVALKVFDEATFGDPRALARFRREAEITAALEHPNVVPVYAVGEEDGALYIAMKYLGGPSLDRQERPLSAIETAKYGIDIAKALASAHALGILHRDVKPGNILLDGERPIVVDFGLARAKNDVALTQTGAVPGTLAYLAPEALKFGAAAVGPSVDIYALGATLYEICSGAPCFDSEDPETLVRRILDENPKPLGLSADDRDFGTIVDKCLRKEPKDRYATMDEVVADLTRFIEQRPIIARPMSLAERTTRFVRRNRVLSMLGASALIVFLGLSFSLLTRVVREKTAARLTVEACERAIEAFDVDGSMSSLHAVQNLELGFDHARLERLCDGLLALDEMLDHLLRGHESIDPRFLSERLEVTRNSGIDTYHPKLAHLGSALAAYLLRDTDAARDHLARAESVADRSRASVAIRALLDGATAELGDVPAASAVDHALTFSALRLAGAKPTDLRSELDAARARDPTDYRVKLADAIMLDAEGEFESALAAFHALERSGRSNAQLIRSAAVDRLRLNDIDGCLAELDRVPENERTPVDTKSRLAALFQARRIEQFDALLADSLERWPSSPEILMCRLMREQSQGALESVLKTCDAIASNSTFFMYVDRAKAESLRARYHLLRSPTDHRIDPAAVDSLNREIEVELPRMVDHQSRSIVQLTRARTAVLAGDNPTALSRFRAAVLEEPNEPVSRVALAEYLYSLQSKPITVSAPSLASEATRERAEQRREARDNARAVLDMKRRRALTFTPEIMINAALIEAALSKLDNDKTSCVDAAKIGIDTARETGTSSAQVESLTKLLDWANSP